MTINPYSDNLLINPSKETNTTDSVQSASSPEQINSIINTDNSVVQCNQSGTSLESISEINEETYEFLIKDIQNKIEQKKQDLNDVKKNRGWLSSLGNGIAQVFGGGDSSKKEEIEKLENQLKSLNNGTGNIQSVYKNVMGKELDANTLASLQESSAISKNLTSDQNQQIQGLLTQQYDELKTEFEDAKDKNGWISGGWDKFKNWTGIGASSNKTQTQLDNMKEQLDDLKDNPENLAKAYKSITGRDLNNEELTKLANGEISLKDASKASESVKKYSDGQKMATDVVGDVVSGIVAVAAVAAAPFTGGASLLLAAGVGAAVKVGLKASDCIGNEKTYGLKDLAYDSVTGSINGLMAPISNGIGGAAGTGVAKAFGLKTVESTAKTALTQAVKTAGKEVAEETIEQTAKQTGKNFLTRVLAKQGSEYVLEEGAKTTAKTFLGKTLAYGTDMAVDGTISGATDGFARAIGEGRIEDIPSEMLNGAVGGLVAAPIIGGGFRLSGKFGSKVAGAINEKITFSRVLPDGVSTALKQGETGDCNLLSVIDGMLANPQTAKTLKKSLSTTVDGNYQVKIGDKIVQVTRDSLSDNALSDTTGIRIIEQAYKQVNGGSLDGGFAEQVAKEFGLNPVHITQEGINDELLDNIAKNQDNFVLSMGTRIDRTTGSINPEAVGGEHYFTIKNIDQNSKKITITSTLNPSEKIELSYDDFKKAALSIDGGSIKSTDISSSVRAEGDVAFKAGRVNTPEADAKIISSATNIAQKKRLQMLYGLKGADNLPRFSYDELASLMTLTDNQFQNIIQRKIDNIRLGGQRLNGFQMTLLAQAPVENYNNLLANNRLLLNKVNSGTISLEKALIISNYSPQNYTNLTRHLNKNNGSKLNLKEINWIVNLSKDAVDSPYTNMYTKTLAGKEYQGVDAKWLSYLPQSQLDVIQSRNLYSEINGRSFSGKDMSLLSSLPDSSWENLSKRELFNSKYSNEEVAYLADLPDSEWQKATERKLFDTIGSKELTGSEISTYSKMSDAMWQNVIDRNLLSSNFNSSDIYHLSSLSEVLWENVQKRDLLNGYNGRAFTGAEIKELSKIHDINWNRLNERKILDGIGGRKFNVEDSIYLSKIPDQVWTQTVDRNLINGYHEQLNALDIKNFSFLNESQWNNIEKRGLFNKYNQSVSYELALLDDATYDRAVEISSFKNKEGATLNAGFAACLIDFDLKNANFKSKTNMLGLIKGAKSFFSAEDLKELKLDLDSLESKIQKSMSQTITPMDVSSDAKLHFGKYFMANNDPKIENILKTADFEGYAKNGLPLEYPRTSFLEDLDDILSELNDTQRSEILKKLDIEVSSGNISSYEGILKLTDLDVQNPTEKKVFDIVNKFTYENKVVTGNADLDQTLNSLIEGMPEFVNVIGKQQHDTQAYSVDIHILKVLKEALNNPEYQKLSDLDKTVLKYSTILHDLAKQENIVDKGHQDLSALYARNIMEKFTGSRDVKDRVFEMVKNHHWLEEYNTNSVTPENIATRFRKPEDYSIARIMAESDLKGVNEQFFEKFGSALSPEKQAPLANALENIYDTGNILLTSKVAIKSKIPQVEYNGKKYEVINFTDMGDNVTPENVGFYGIKSSKDLRFMVHMLPNESLSTSAKTIDLLSDVANSGVLSTSMLSLDNKSTFMRRKYGLVVDVDNSNVANAFNGNQSSGYGKDFNSFVNITNNSKSPARTFLKNNVLKELDQKYGVLSDDEYGQLYKLMQNKKYITQIKDDVSYKIGEKSILGSDIKAAVSNSQDQLFVNTYTPHNEIVVYNPKISAIVCKESSLDNVPQEMLDFAESKNLPIYLIGE